MHTRLVLIVILGLCSCSTVPTEPQSAQAVGPLFYKCLQSHCIDDAPGARADAEEPAVKQQYFDRCLAKATAEAGSPDHTNEIDRCMAGFGYFRALGNDSNVSGSGSPDCDITRESAVSVAGQDSKDRLIVSIKGSPCYEASLAVSVISEGGGQLYEYVARFKQHTSSHWEDPSLDEDARYVVERFVDPNAFGLTSELPLWMPEADYYEQHYQSIQISREDYDELRQKAWVTYTHPIHYEGWRVVAFDRENQRSIVVSEGTL